MNSIFRSFVLGASLVGVGAGYSSPSAIAQTNPASVSQPIAAQPVAPVFAEDEFRAVDTFQPGDEASERAHPVTGERHFSGPASGGFFHDARENGFFEVTLRCAPQSAPQMAQGAQAAQSGQVLRATYWGSDQDREFEVLVDGTRVARQTLENPHPGRFFTVDYPLSPALLRGKQTLTVRFQSLNGKTAGGVFGLAVGQVVPPAPPQPNPVQSIRRTPTGLLLKQQRGTLQLQVFSDRIVRVWYSPTDAPAPAQSLAVIARPLAGSWRVTQERDSVTLRTAALQVRVNRAWGSVTFLNAAGQPILAENNGGRVLRANTIGSLSTLRSRQGFALAPGEAVFGLGQHQDGVMNYRGRTVHLQQRNTEVAVPVLVSSRGYGVLWDNPAITDVDAGERQPDTLTWSSEAARGMDYYFLYGPELDTVIGGYRQLTGAAPLFGRWAWGLWQSRERYTSQQELLNVVGEYRKRNIPLDGIIQDWQYWTPQPWGSHAFDPQRYPDPAQMMRDLHAANVHLLISVWPKFDVGSPNARALNAIGGLYPQVIPYVYPPGQGQWYDPFKPQARALYWQQMSQQIFSKGVDGWWLDASEAELSGNWGEFRNYQTGAGRGAEVFNAYPLLHTKAVYEGQRAQTGDKRAFILTRSGYAGQQRNAAVVWSGDIGASWDVFARQVPAGINFTLSGIPYWNTDTGGFFGNDPDRADFRELFTRWFQFSTFCPMLRVHGTDKPKELWRFPADIQRTLVNYDNLRYHLLPYIYATSWQVTSQGSSMMRGLVLDFRTDPKVYGIPDQYMFGPAFMACPVTQPGATTRSVYLPQGTTWTDFWTGQTYGGGQTLTAAAPLGTMPLYVRAGAIVPYGPAVQNASAPADPLELRVYRGADGAFTLYEDEGDSYRYEQGAYSTIPLRWNERAKTLTIGARQGRFLGMQTTRTLRLVLVRPGQGVDVPSTSVADKTIAYNGRALTVRF